MHWKKDNASTERKESCRKLPMSFQCFSTMEHNVLMIMIRKALLIPSSCRSYRASNSLRRDTKMKARFRRSSAKDITRNVVKYAVNVHKVYLPTSLWLNWCPGFPYVFLSAGVLPLSSHKTRRQFKCGRSLRTVIT